MARNTEKRKEFLLRKNIGRLELNNLNNYLNQYCLEDSINVPLEYSDEVSDIMKIDNTSIVISKGQEVSYEVLNIQLERIIANNMDDLNIFMWTHKSDYYGLVKIQNILSPTCLISLLQDTYFGGYFSLFFKDSNRRLDIDYDENPLLKDQWYYSFVYYQLSSG